MDFKQSFLVWNFLGSGQKITDFLHEKLMFLLAKHCSIKNILYLINVKGGFKDFITIIIIIIYCSIFIYFHFNAIHNMTSQYKNKRDDP